METQLKASGSKRYRMKTLTVEKSLSKEKVAASSFSASKPSQCLNLSETMQNELYMCALSAMRLEIESIGVPLSEIKGDFKFEGIVATRYTLKCAWMLNGLDQSVAQEIIERVEAEVLDRVKFIEECLIERKPAVVARSTQFALLYGPKGHTQRFVNKNTFNSTKGKYQLIDKVNCKFVAQGFGAVGSVVKGIQVILRMLSAAGNESTQKICDGLMMPLDIARFILDLLKITEGEWRFLDIASLLLSFYSLYNRATEWLAQGFETLAFSALTLALPKPMFEILKRMSFLTTAKLLDDASMFNEFFASMLEFLKKCVEKMPAVISQPILNLLETLHLGSHYRLHQEQVDLLKKWKLNRKVIIEECFRANVNRVYQDSIQNPSLQEWSRRSNMVRLIQEEFRHLKKCVSGYETVRRPEPVIAVFEGIPGTFKSVLMNQLIEVARLHPTNPRSVYAHTVKPTKDGKDFYDTYNNEDIVTLDDLGQQGNSQFRTLINWGSEVKYPLDCADAGLKHTKYFNSGIVLFTTNSFSRITGFTKDDCIATPAALFRRTVLFDFNNIKRTADVLTGTVVFKFFDEDRGIWLEGIPYGIEGHSTCNADDREELLAWMYYLVDAIEKKKASFASLNEVSPTMAANVAKLASTGAKLGYDSPTAYSCNNTFDPAVARSAMAQTFGEKVVETFHDATDYMSDFIPSYDLVSDYILGKCSDLYDHVSASKLALGTLVCLSVAAIAGCVYKWKPRQKMFEAQAGLEKLRAACDEVPSCHSVNTAVDYISRGHKFCVIHKDSSDASTFVWASGHLIVMPFHISNSKEIVFSMFSDLTLNQKIFDHSSAKLVYAHKQDDVSVYMMNSCIATPLKSMVGKIAHGEKYDLLITPFGVKALDTILLPGEDTHYRRRDVNKQVIYENVATKNNSVTYNLSHEGLCASLISTTAGKVGGMHVAGMGKTGISILWSKDTTDYISSLFEKDVRYILEWEPRSIEGPAISAVRIDVSLGRPVPSRSDLVPSPLYGVFPVTKEPADLNVHGKDTINILAAKSFEDVGYVHSADLKFSEEYLRTLLSPYKPLTIGEVINGNKDLAGLNKKSSNGFGYAQGKEHYVDFEKGSLTAKGQKRYDEVKSGILLGKIDPKELLWVECLKDELRTLPKVCKPRTFRCCSVIMQVLTKQCFGNLVAKIQSEKWRNGIMIGINPVKDWPKLFGLLQQCIAKWGGDFRKWDGKMLTQIMELVAKVIPEFCEDEEWKVISEFLLVNMAHCYVVIGSKTYKLTHSMPSGSFLTALLNSIVNKMMTACWYSFVCRTNGIPVNLMDFIKKVLDFVYGDDKLVSIRGLDPELFGMKSMASYFNHLGVGFTTSTKAEVMSNTESWKEMTFLKRSFVWDHVKDRLVCPLDRDTLCSSLSWYCNKKDLEVVLSGKLDAFQREAYLWDDYAELMRVLEAEMEKRGVFHTFLTEKNLDQLWRTGDYLLKDYTSFEEC